MPGSAHLLLPKTLEAVGQNRGPADQAVVLHLAFGPNTRTAKGSFPVAFSQHLPSPPAQAGASNWSGQDQVVLTAPKRAMRESP